MISVCSDKGTIHLFLLDPKAAQAVKVRPELVENESYDFIGQLREQNKKSVLSSFGAVLPSYFSSEWSYAQFKIPDVNEVKSAIFGNRLCVVTLEGKYYAAEIPSAAGECELKTERMLITHEED